MSEPALAINLATTEMAAPDELQLLPQISATADVCASDPIDLWLEQTQDAQGGGVKLVQSKKSLVAFLAAHEN